MEKKSVRLELRLLLYYVVALVVMCLVLLGYEVVQRTMFEAADSLTNWIIAGATMFSALISIAALVSLLATLQLNRDAVEAARASTRLSRETSRIDLRPWLRIEVVSWKRDANVHPMVISVKLRIQNLGRTAATNVAIHAKIAQCDRGSDTEAYDLLDDFTAELYIGDLPHKELERLVVFPNDTENVEIQISGWSPNIPLYQRALFVYANYGFDSEETSLNYQTAAAFWLDPQSGQSALVLPCEKLVQFAT